MPLPAREYPKDCERSVWRLILHSSVVPKVFHFGVKASMSVIGVTHLSETWLILAQSTWNPPALKRTTLNSVISLLSEDQ